LATRSWILVLFGAPLTLTDHAERAVACALAMQLAMREVNARNRARHLPRLKIGIGVHTGDVVVGNIGSSRRARCGAVGASVNLASRLESCAVGGQILISDGTRQAVGVSLALGSCLHVGPKGVRVPLAVYEALGLGGTHGLNLPAADDALRLLPEPLRCRYFVMAEKLVGRTAFDGTLTHLSRTAAELS
jgi:adenylate cyclase